MSIAYKVLAGLLLLIAVGVAGYSFGHHVEALAFDAYKSNLKKASSDQKAASAEVTTKIVTQYIPQIQVVHDVGATIIKKVPVYVTKEDDARYQLPSGFVRLHDAAAIGMPLPAASATVLAEPSPVEISTAANVIASNYQLCRTEREKYMALWQWTQQQAAIKTNPR